MRFYFYSDGITHVLFEPLDFIARLAALVPRPRVNLTRYNGVFAPNSRYRARVTPAKQDEAEVPLWVSSSHSVVYQSRGCFWPLAEVTDSV